MGVLTTAGGKPLLFGAKVLLAALGAGSAPPPADTGTGTVTLSEGSLLDYQIYQHVGGIKAIPVAGTVTGADGVVEARIVDETTGTPITTWAAVGTSSGGAFTGSISMAKGLSWGKVQARKASNPAAVTTGVKRFGVGEWVVLGGQSNMEHMWSGEVEYSLSSSKVRAIEVKPGDRSLTAYGRLGNYNDALTPGTPYAGAVPGGYSSYSVGATDKGDGAVHFANELSAAAGCLVGVALVAISSTNIDDWQQGGTYWNSMTAAITAIGGDVGTLIWYQGEQNATAANIGPTYIGKVDTFRTSIMNFVGRTSANFAFGLVALGPCTTYGPEGSFGSIRAAQVGYAANAGCYLAAVASDLSSPSGDPVHIDNDSRKRLGRRMAKSTAAFWAGSPRPGPKIAGASRTGRAVTPTITGATGALRDAAGGNGSALKGFRFFDAGAGGAQIGYTSTISGGVPVLTLASDPVGALTMDFMMANTPLGSTTSPPASAILVDSSVVPGDTLGLPLQPCAAITVS